MLEIKNTEVFGLERSMLASGNPMSIGEINTTLAKCESVSTKRIDTCKKLGSVELGSGHDHYLLGIHVQFDIKYPQYFTIEAERYHNFEIISSQSKMHKLTMMGRDNNFSGMFNKYVDKKIIDLVRAKIEVYNMISDLVQRNIDGYEETKYRLFMNVISNLPMGFEMWMTCDLTFLQIKTIYFQRRNHKLKEDWGVFCDWAESLPMFRELVLTSSKEQ